MDKLRVLAMYLPQFHRTKENDEWWGEGFTEWTTVRAAERLYEGHNQPREPLNDNYYDLMQKETMQWQAGLAEQYGVDGFCFYHYYFKDGRKVLEKPAENLLNWKDIQMPFCFCWANETWARTWSNISYANSWSEKFETNVPDGKAILLEQYYGERDAWIKHFEYLYPFFADDRYLNVEDKPLFIFYKPEEITCLPEMISCWNELAVERGLKGIYAVGTNTTKRIPGVNAVLFQGPVAYRSAGIAGLSVKEKLRQSVKTYDYDAIYKNALLAENPNDIKTYYGAFVDYDDTPRRGKLGCTTHNVSVDKFEEYLYKIAIKNRAAGNEILFINAWNEWGEGNYLEPDNDSQYGYLESVQKVKDRCDKFLNYEEIRAEWMKIANALPRSEENQDLINDINKYRKFYQLLDRWLLLKENQWSVLEYFKDFNYRKIIIYGYASMGKHLYRELQDSETEVVAIIDKRQGLKCQEVPILIPEQNIPECDVVVVTAINDFVEIKEELNNKKIPNVISLWDIIFYSYDK